MIEVTDEMVEAVASAIQDAHAPGHGLSHVALYQARAALAAVAPLIEAQASAEIERLKGELANYMLGFATAKEDIEVCSYENERLRTDLAQARAAAIEEAAKVIERRIDDRYDVGWYNALCWARLEVLSLSRPVSERDEADTAPAPAMSMQCHRCAGLDPDCKACRGTGRLVLSTAPAPAISGGENALDRIVAELKWIVAHAGFPRSRGEIVDRAKFALALAAADRSASR